MSRKSRTFSATVWLLVAGVLTGCGFQPLYGDRENTAAAEDLLEFVYVPPIEDRIGQLVRIELTNRLTPTRPAPQAIYILSVQLTESRANLAVRKDASATRANLTISAAFELRRLSDGQPMTTGSVRSVNSYDIVESEYATLEAEADARRRGATDVADGITDRLSIFFTSESFRRQSGATR